MTEKTIDVTVPGNGYVLTNPKLSPLQYWKGRDLDLRKLPLKLAKEMAANPACRWIQAEAPAPTKKADPAPQPAREAKDKGEKA